MNPNKVVLKAGSQKLTFRLGTAYIKRVTKAFGFEQFGKGLKEIGALVKEDPFETVPLMMQISHNYHLEKEGATEDELVDIETVYDWIDEGGGIGGELIPAFLRAWAASINQGVPQNDDAEGNGKALKAKDNT